MNATRLTILSTYLVSYVGHIGIFLPLFALQTVISTHTHTRTHAQAHTHTRTHTHSHTHTRNNQHPVSHTSYTELTSRSRDAVQTAHARPQKPSAPPLLSHEAHWMPGSTSYATARARPHSVAHFWKRSYSAIRKQVHVPVQLMQIKNG